MWVKRLVPGFRLVRAEQVAAQFAISLLTYQNAVQAFHHFINAPNERILLFFQLKYSVKALSFLSKYRWVP